jgi:hypothetical protein
MALDQVGPANPKGNKREAVSREVNMTNARRLVIVAASTVLLISSFSTIGFAAPIIHCEDSVDCPPGSHCRFTHKGHRHKKGETGICVGAHVPAR